MFKTKYRVVPDDYNGYEVQHRKWYWPFWTEIGVGGRIANTHSSLEKAKEFIKQCKSPVLYEE